MEIIGGLNELEVEPLEAPGEQAGVALTFAALLPGVYLLAPSLAQNASNWSLVHRVWAFQPRLHSSCVGVTTIVPPGLT